MRQHQEPPRLRRPRHLASTLHSESQLFHRCHFAAILAEQAHFKSSRIMLDILTTELEDSTYVRFRVSTGERLALLRPGLQAVRVHANYGRLLRHGTRRVELHAYSD